MSFNDYDTKRRQSPSKLPVPISSTPTTSTIPKQKLLSDQLAAKIFQINSNVAYLSKTVNLLGTAHDDLQIRNRMTSVLESTRESVREVNNGIKQVENSVTQTKLNKDFEQVLKRFHQVSKLCASKSRQVLTHYQERLLPPEEQFGNGNEEEMDEEESRPLLLKQQQSQIINNDIDFNESLILERETDIQAIEQSMAEVNEIFRDLGTLVSEQGYMIDNIESNVENVVVNMQGAVDEVKKADKHQRGVRSKMCWILGIIVVVAVILLLILL